jgi:hypothetical protein
MDNGSFGFFYIYTKCRQNGHILHLMNEPCLKKWNMDEFHLLVIAMNE